MTAVKDFEKDAVRLLTGDVLPAILTEKVLAEPQSVQYEFTGCGYFLTLFLRASRKNASYATSHWCSATVAASTQDAWSSCKITI